MDDSSAAKHDSRTSLLRVAEARLHSLSFWAELNWNLHNWFVALSLIGSLIVPFGIAALPYVSKESAHALNLALVAISAASLVMQFVNLQLRLSQRSVRARRDRDRLAMAVADYKDAAISRDEFKAILEVVMASAASEELS